MTNQPTNKAVETLSDAEKTRIIKQVVVKAGEDLRQRHTWLQH